MLSGTFDPMLLDRFHNTDCLEGMQSVPDATVDMGATDPPYGIGFMNRNWDKALPDPRVWCEYYRVLKAGSFLFVMCTPRIDCQWRLAQALEGAGFNVGFTPIYWCFASGFPKAMNMGKAVDKKPYRKQRLELKSYLDVAIRNCGKTRKQIDTECGFTACSYTRVRFRADDGWGEALPDPKKWFRMKEVIGFDNKWDWFIVENERIVLGQHKSGIGKAFDNGRWGSGSEIVDETSGKTDFEGSYGGFQPKPAVEVIIVAMKPLSEKTYVDQALANGKGVTWLDDCRIPFASDVDRSIAHNNALGPVERYATSKKIYEGGKKSAGFEDTFSSEGRFPANLLVSDDMLNDGKLSISMGGIGVGKLGESVYGTYSNMFPVQSSGGLGDSGSFSRYFDLDAWWNKKITELPKSVQKTFPFLIVPKASNCERNKGLTSRRGRKVNDGRRTEIDNPFQRGETVRRNTHPTVKPIQLGSYLITLGSRPNDVILDAFAGSGSFLISAILTGRHYIGYEIEKESYEIAQARIRAWEGLNPYLAEPCLVSNSASQGGH